ncbi:MAG: hypothetical protein NC218_08050 [Acetobacter sp.]|nr:hypothetical protein [Acetobacter sp.]
MTLEDIMHNYRFLPKSKKAFRDNPKMVDGLPESATKAGARAYARLITMLYDVGKVTGCAPEVNNIVEALDDIVSGGNY